MLDERDRRLYRSFAISVIIGFALWLIIAVVVVFAVDGVLHHMGWWR